MSADVSITDSVESDEDLLEKKLKHYVFLFIELFEDKLKQYQIEAKVGSTAKTGKLSENIAGPIGQIPAAVIGFATGIPGAAGGAGTAGATISKKLWSLRSGKAHKTKSKKVSEIFGNEINKDDLRLTLAKASGNIFRSFQFQFNMMTDADKSWRRGIEKLAVDAAARAMNFIANQNENELDIIPIDVFITKAIILGQSKEGTVDSVLPTFIKTLAKRSKGGRSIVDDVLNVSLKTSDVYEYTDVAMVNEKGLLYEFYKKKRKLKKSYDFGYRIILEWEKESLSDYEEVVERNFFGDICKYKWVDEEEFDALIEGILNEYNKDDTDCRLNKIEATTTNILENVQRSADEIKKQLDEYVKVKTSSETIKIFNVVGHVKSFTGRVTELEDIHKLLQNSLERVVISQCASIAGLGGIGKSELARKYAFDYYKFYNENVIWIAAETFESLRLSFEEVASELKISITVVTESNIMQRRDIQSIVKDVYKKVNDVGGLFIFDNAENFEIIQPFLPRTTPEKKKIYVLITSRNQDWEIGDEGDVPVIRLDGFLPKDAFDFVKTALNIAPDDESHNNDVEKLTETLQYFPLALRSATAYIMETQKMLRKRGNEQFWINDFLKEYEDEGTKKNLLDYSSKTGYNRYTETVFTTWRVTFKSIEQNFAHGKNALEIIESMAYFAPDKIPMELFFCRKMKIRDFWDTIDLLEKYSLITLKAGISSVHRLVQAVIRLWLQSENREEKIIENSLNILQDLPNELGTINQHITSAWSYACRYTNLIEKYYFRNVLCYKHCTPLHLLAGDNLLKSVKNIIDYLKVTVGSNAIKFIDVFDQYDRTPLYTAAENGCIDVVKEFVNKGSKTDVQSCIAYPSLSTRKSHGWTALHVAAFNNYEDVVRYLYNRNKNLLKFQDSVGRTPAALAAYAGNMNIVKILEPNNNILLFHAAIRAAINNDDEESLVKIIQDLNEKDEINSIVCEWTPLHLLAFGGYEKAVEILISYGANLNSVSDDGFTPLHAACSNGHLEVAKLLIERGANKNAINNDGWTIVHAAAQNGHPHVLEYLLTLGFDVNIKDFKNTTPLQTAAYHGKINVVKFLLENKQIPIELDLNPTDILGATPILAAMISYNCDIVMYLLEHEASLNTDLSPDSLVSKLGLSLLHVAAAYDDTKMAKVLIESYRVDVDAGKDKSFTPLHVAALYGSTKIIDYLIGKGADAYAPLQFNQMKLAVEKIKQNPTLQNCNAHIVVDVMFRIFDYIEHSFQLIPGDLGRTQGYSNKSLPTEKSEVFIKCLRLILSSDYIKKQINNAKFYVCERKYPHLQIYVGGHFYTGGDSNTFKCSPLHLAIENVEVDVVKYMLSNDRNICHSMKCKDYNGKTPIELIKDKLVADPSNNDLKTIEKILLDYDESSVKSIAIVPGSQHFKHQIILAVLCISIAYVIARFIFNR